MRTSLKKLSSSFLVWIISFSAFARPVAQVVEVSGKVFVVNKEGKTASLKADQHIEESSEILVGEGGTITLNDYYNSSYHLISGSHLKFYNKSVQLKKGKAWVKSMTNKYPLALTTANGQIDFSKAEFITTFDQTSNRTQFFIVNGEVDVSNILNKNIKYLIPAGSFTFIDPEIDNGIPRNPTKVGIQSLNSALADFKKLPEKIFQSRDSIRKIASVNEEKINEAPIVKKGEIIYLTTHRKPASIEQGEAHKYYKKILTKKNGPTKVKIKIYGSAWQKPEPVVKPIRTPASIKVIEPPVPERISVGVVVNDSEYEGSLKKHEAEQPKYSKDLGNLINELKSY